MKVRIGLLTLTSFIVAATIAGVSSARSEASLCAFRESTTRADLVATTTLHVVQDGCQLSFVSISKFADGNSIYDTATKTFNASDQRVTLSVQLPCGVGSETDVVLGPPTLYPPTDLDLGATAFDVACPSGGGGSTGGGSQDGTGGAGGSGGSTGGAGTTALPDLKTTVTAASTTAPRVGTTVPVTVTVANVGSAGAGGVHVLVSLAANAIPQGSASSSRGPGCTGLTVIDCDLGSLGAGSSATVQLRMSAAAAGFLFVGAQAQEIENDANLSDNAGTVRLKILPRLRPFALTVVASRTVAHDQLVFVELTRAASVTAQLYRHGSPQPIRWRRSLSAGTVLVRVPLPKLTVGERFSIVFRATGGGKTVSKRLQLHN